MRIFSFVFLLFTTFYLLFTGTAFASEVSIGVGAPEADGSRDVAVLMRSSSPINALEGAVNVTLGAEVLDISDAGSPVQFWIERPHLSDAKDKITFSGIIPGGFSGEAALFHIHTKADATKFSIDKSATRILLNDGEATADITKVAAARALPAQFVLQRNRDDKVAPLPFVLQKAVLPTENGDTPSLVFNTHDDGSGVSRYEITYSPVAIDPNDPSLVWQPVSNPQPLLSEQGKKFIYLKAIDRAGNVRIAEVPPSSLMSGLPMHSIPLFFAILSIIVCACVLLFVRYRVKHLSPNGQSDK